MNGVREDPYHISDLHAHIIIIRWAKRIAFLRFSISLPCRKKPKDTGALPSYTTKMPCCHYKSQ